MGISGNSGTGGYPGFWKLTEALEREGVSLVALVTGFSVTTLAQRTVDTTLLALP